MLGQDEVLQCTLRPKVEQVVNDRRTATVVENKQIIGMIGVLQDAGDAELQDVQPLLEVPCQVRYEDQHGDSHVPGVRNLSRLIRIVAKPHESSRRCNTSRDKVTALEL